MFAVVASRPLAWSLLDLRLGKGWPVRAAPSMCQPAVRALAGSTACRAALCTGIADWTHQRSRKDPGKTSTCEQFPHHSSSANSCRSSRDDCALCQQRLVEGSGRNSNRPLWRWPCRCGMQIHLSCMMHMRIRLQGSMARGFCRRIVAVRVSPRWPLH